MKPPSPGLTATLLTAACLWSTQAATEDKTLEDSETYQKVCAQCHQTDVGPDLRGRFLPPEYIHYIVRNGFRAMPAFPHSALDDETLQQISALIQASPQPE